MGKFTKQEKENVFNSSITYLDRMSLWIERAHLYSADDDDIFDAFMALEEWAAELDPLLNPDEQEKTENFRKKTKLKLLKQTKDGESLIYLRETFRPFQLHLGRLTQKKGLLMKQEDAYDVHKDTRI